MTPSDSKNVCRHCGLSVQWVSGYRRGYRRGGGFWRHVDSGDEWCVLTAEPAYIDGSDA